MLGWILNHSKQSNILFQTIDTIMPLNTPDRYLNPDVIGVSQDTYGHQGIRIFGGDLFDQAKDPCMTDCAPGPTPVYQQVGFSNTCDRCHVSTAASLRNLCNHSSQELTKITSTRNCFHITFQRRPQWQRRTDSSLVFV